MTVGQRIKNRRKELGLSVDEVADKLGKNRATIYRYESNEIEKLPTTVLEPLSKVLKTTPSALMGWEDPMESNISAILPSENIRMIPVFNSVSAGFGAYADNYITEYMPLYIENDEEAENTMCITVEGNSMYPKIEDGDHIQVLKQNWCDDGQIAVVLINGEDAVVKKIKFGDNSTTLISVNPEYEPRVFEGAEQEELRILGVVRKIIKDV